MKAKRKMFYIVIVLMVLFSFFSCIRKNEDNTALNHIDKPEYNIMKPEKIINAIAQELEKPTSVLVALHYLDFPYDEFSSLDDSITVFMFNLAMHYQLERLIGQGVSFSREEIDYLLNLTFGNRVSVGDININDVEDFSYRPLYNNGIFTFRLSESVVPKLIFLFSPSENTFVYSYKLGSVAHGIDETGSVKVIVENSTGNPYGITIKSVQFLEKNY